MSVWIKRVFLAGAMLALLAGGSPEAQAKDVPIVDMGMADEMMPSNPGGAVPGQYIIVLNDDVTNVRGAAAEMARTHGLGVQFIYTSALKGFAATVPEGRLNALERDPRIDYIEQDQWGGIDSDSVDFNPISNVQRINADLVADVDGTTVMDGHDDVRVDVDVAVIDTGIQPDHPDLNVVRNINCTAGGRLTPTCEVGVGGAMHWHGTHVAGTIAALDNGTDALYYGVPIDVAGVSPGARLWAVRVLDKRGSGTVSQYIAGVNWVINNGTIEVANSSLGYPSSQVICDAVDALAVAGVTHAVSAGNENSLVFKSPGNCGNSVITTSAMADYNGEPGGGGAPTCFYSDGSFDPDDTLARFSNYGPLVDVTAPGVCVVSTYLDSWYAVAGGTSMSSPHVAGAAALLAASGVSDPATIQNTLKSEGDTSWDVESSYYEPLIDVSNANVFVPATLPASETPAPVNASPSAQFNYGCTGLTCDFTDQSNDSDGTVVDWDWNLGGEATSTEQNPSHTFAAYDVEYTVTLTVWDDDVATGQTSQSFTLTEEAVGGDITLAAVLKGKMNRKGQKVQLQWGGAAGANVDIWRDDVLVTTTANDGAYNDTVTAAGTHIYKVCEAGTSTCSNTAEVTF